MVYVLSVNNKSFYKYVMADWSDKLQMFQNKQGYRYGYKKKNTIKQFLKSTILSLVLLH